MNFDDFVKEYESNKDIKSIDSHVIRKYVPIAEKKIILDTMANKAKGKTNNNVNYIDQLLLKINFDLSVVILYTDINISKSENLNTMEIYDFFKKEKLINRIYSIVGEEEITELAMTQQYIVDTFYDVENSIQEVILNNVNAYVEMIKAYFSPVIEKIMSEDFDANEIKDTILDFKEVDNK